MNSPYPLEKFSEGEDINQVIIHELRGSLKKLELAFSAIKEAVVWTNGAGMIQWCNKSFEALFPQSRLTILGSSLFDYFPATARQKYNPIQSLILANHSKIVYETPAGKSLEIEFNQFHLQDQELSYVFVISDIGDRLKMEERVRQSEQHFQQIVGTIQEVFWIFDPDTHTMVYVSPAYESIFGEPCQTLYEQYDRWVELIHQEDREMVRVAFAAIAETQGFDLEYRVVRSDGSLRWIRDQAYQEAHGHSTRIIGLARDITEEKNQEEQLRMTLARERELNILRANLIAMASHEFRTPLTVILSSTELLAQFDQTWTTERKGKAFEQIRQNIDRLNHILEDIIFYEDIENNAFSYTPQSLNVLHFCQEMIEEIHPVLRGNQRIIFEHSLENIHRTHFALDRILLFHILKHLLTNAVRYSARDQAVRFSLQQTKTELIFTVRDQGVGISEEDLAHIFEPFYRTKMVSHIKGTGLGLAIAARAAAAHQGKLEVQSKVGKGSTFSLHLSPNKQ